MDQPQPDIPPLPQPARSPEQILCALREQIARVERTHATEPSELVSSGLPALDRRLPQGGFRWGTLVEWLSSRPGCGAETLALGAAREACRLGGALVVLDRLREFYPPAAVCRGIPPEAMVIVQAGCEADQLWALDQALRSLGVAAVLAWPEKLDDRTFRRLQLAAEQGGGLGLLIRPEKARREPSWADFRLRVEALPTVSQGRRRLRIQVLHCRSGSRGETVDVEIDDETHPLHSDSQRAAPADRRRATGS